MKIPPRRRDRFASTEAKREMQTTSDCARQTC